MDVEGYIKPGDDFVEVLEAQVSACEVMVVVIGAQRLSLEKNGRPRIHDPRDPVHIEIATALRRKIRVIPALVDGARMPDESELPEALKPLARRQAIRLSHERFAADGQGLVKALQEVLRGPLPLPELLDPLGPAPAARPIITDPALTVPPGSGESFRDVATPWCPEMVVVPAGAFTVNAQKKVTIAKPFAVGRYAVTRGEFSVFVRETGYSVPDEADTYEGGKWELRKGRSFRNPGFIQDDSHPVVCVNWYDAKAYVQWLSGRMDKGYRLLSDAEWEYACRAGTQTLFWWGSSISTGQANCRGSYAQKTMPVKSFQPNPWGLYQVHGNVNEWVEDCMSDDVHNPPSDGSARTTGYCSERILRGGSWLSDPQDLAFSFRFTLNTAGDRHSDVGFRVARTLS
jgi:formylglycine-generating enzyme required for sulfatase activity